MRRVEIGLGLLAVIAAGGWFYGASRLMARDEAPSLTLQGVLLVGEFFGPPNYGENPATDAREYQANLQLPAPVATQEANFFKLDRELKAKDGYFIQIVILDDSLRARSEKLVGQHVEVVGVPFAAVTGHHRTGFLLEVKKLRAIKEWKW